MLNDRRSRRESGSGRFRFVRDLFGLCVCLSSRLVSSAAPDSQLVSCTWRQRATAADSERQAIAMRCAAMRWPHGKCAFQSIRIVRSIPFLDASLLWGEECGNGSGGEEKRVARTTHRRGRADEWWLWRNGLGWDGMRRNRIYAFAAAHLCENEREREREHMRYAWSSAMNCSHTSRTEQKRAHLIAALMRSHTGCRLGASQNNKFIVRREKTAACLWENMKFANWYRHDSADVNQTNSQLK